MSGTLFVGDVHGCAKELAKLLRKVKPDRVVLVGDIFSRGPDPAGVFKLIERYSAEAVLGNHDEVVLDTWRPGDKLPRRAFKWLKRRPVMLREKGFIAVHAGVRPDKPRKTRRQDALTMRDWNGRPWFEQYQGRRLVIHGHDARRGLNDRRPYTLGLDTGCVNGGRLSGYHLERDRVVSVRSSRSC